MHALLFTSPKPSPEWLFGRNFASVDRPLASCSLEPHGQHLASDNWAPICPRCKDCPIQRIWATPCVGCRHDNATSFWSGESAVLNVSCEKLKRDWARANKLLKRSFLRLLSRLYFSFGDLHWLFSFRLITWLIALFELRQQKSEVARQDFAK